MKSEHDSNLRSYYVSAGMGNNFLIEFIKFRPNIKIMIIIYSLKLAV